MVKWRSQWISNRYHCLPYPVALTQLTVSLRICISPTLTWTSQLMWLLLIYYKGFFFFCSSNLVLIISQFPILKSAELPHRVEFVHSGLEDRGPLRGHGGRLFVFFGLFFLKQPLQSIYMFFAFPHSVVPHSASRASKGYHVFSVFNFVVMVRTTSSEGLCRVFELRYEIYKM